MKHYAKFSNLSLDLRVDNLSETAQKQLEDNPVDFAFMFLEALNKLLKDNGIEAKFDTAKKDISVKRESR